MKAGGVLVGFGQGENGRFRIQAPNESQARALTVRNCDAWMPGEIGNFVGSSVENLRLGPTYTSIRVINSAMLVMSFLRTRWAWRYSTAGTARPALKVFARRRYVGICAEAGQFVE